ncbi:MAG: hypothetical protein AAF938_17415 [Myxococcota bacterium]
MSHQQLFIHKRRPEWGRAVLASETEDRRQYQFEDGQVRAISERFYSMLEPVNPEEEDAKASVRKLRTLLRHNDLSAAAGDGKVKATMTFGDQIALFRAAVPEGFEAANYRKAYRRGERSTKRAHIEPAIEKVETELAEDVLRPLVDAEDYTGVLEAVRGVLLSTDLISSAERKVLQGIDSDVGEKLIATAFFELLHGEDTFAERFVRLLDAFDRAKVRPTWALTTALPALAEPKNHVCVRPTAFRDQARSLMPKLQLEMTPDLGTYELLQGMAHSARDQLTAADIVPGDLFDVRNFMWLTLRKDAERKLRAL